MYNPQEPSENLSASTEKPTQQHSPIKPEESQYGILEKKLIQVCSKKGCQFLKESSADILADLTHTQEEINTVSKSTVKQFKSKEWYKQKSGFITGSIAQRVINMHRSLDKGLKRNVPSLVQKITCQQSPQCTSNFTVENPQNPRDWGLKHEESARLSFYKIESKKHHKLSLKTKRFLPSTKKPFVGASVENIRTCGCKENCPKAVVEYKCPWKHRHIPPKEAFLTPEIGGEKKGTEFTLKRGSRYYPQVQLQMFVTELGSCDFVVWTEHGILSVTVPYDATFMGTAIEEMGRFWIHHVLPFMAQRLNICNVHQGKENSLNCSPVIQNSLIVTITIFLVNN